MNKFQNIGGKESVSENTFPNSHCQNMQNSSIEEKNLFDSESDKSSTKEELKTKTLLILAAECQDFIWKLLKDSNKLIMDYSVDYAVSCGFNKVVITVLKCHEEKAKTFLKWKASKYSIGTDVVVVDSQCNGSANQFFEALTKNSSTQILVVHANCFYEKRMFQTAAKRLSKSHRSCMLGYIPEVPIAKDDKSHQSVYNQNVYLDWRVATNMFGFTNESIEKIKNHYSNRMCPNSLGVPHVINYSLEQCVSNLLYEDFAIDFVKGRKQFYIVRSQKELEQVYESRGKLKKYNNGVFFDKVDLFFYKTSNQTLAINFDAYSVNYTSYHIYLKKSFDTGINVSDLNSAFHKTRKFTWKNNEHEDYQYGETTSNMSISLEDGSIHVDYEGNWLFHMTGEKYPFTLDFIFDKTEELKIRGQLSSTQANKSPMLKFDEKYMSNSDDKCELDEEVEDNALDLSEQEETKKEKGGKLLNIPPFPKLTVIKPKGETNHIETSTQHNIKNDAVSSEVEPMIFVGYDFNTQFVIKIGSDCYPLESCNWDKVRGCFCKTLDENYVLLYSKNDKIVIEYKEHSYPIDECKLLFSVNKNADASTEVEKGTWTLKILHNGNTILVPYKNESDETSLDRYMNFGQYVIWLKGNEDARKRFMARHSLDYKQTEFYLEPYLLSVAPIVKLDRQQIQKLSTSDKHYLCDYDGKYYEDVDGVISAVYVGDKRLIYKYKDMKIYLDDPDLRFSYKAVDKEKRHYQLQIGKGSNVQTMLYEQQLKETFEDAEEWELDWALYLSKLIKEEHFRLSIINLIMGRRKR